VRALSSLYGLEIGAALGERDEIVVVQPRAPTFVRGVLREDCLAYRAPLMAGCWPASARSLRRSTPTGSLRSFKAMAKASLSIL
jgi:hypothetical protein